MYLFGIMNYSGNVGKTTVAEQLLLENLNGYNLIKVETINSDGSSMGDKFSSHNFDGIIDKATSTLDGAIVDIGSSNIESFFKNMTIDWEGSHDNFDFFIIPVTPFVKQQNDTINIIDDLKHAGVEADRIKVILNMVNPSLTISEQFKILEESDLAGTLNIKSIDQLPQIKFFEFFRTIEKHNISYDQVKKDTRDHRALMRSAKMANDVEEFQKLSKAKLMQDGFKAYQKNLKAAFQALNLPDTAIPNQPVAMTKPTDKHPQAPNKK